MAKAKARLLGVWLGVGLGGIGIGWLIGIMLGHFSGTIEAAIVGFAGFVICVSSDPAHPDGPEGGADGP